MKELTGTGPLLRLILRRDRVLMPAWILALLVGVLGLSSWVISLYPSAADRRQYYDINSASATFAVRNDPLYGSTLGELVTWSVGFVVVEVALVSLLTVIRHTRTEEEAGRRELIGSTAVGRHAGLAAALIATCGANIVFALLVAATVTARGLPVSGSLALGAQFAIAGCVFAAIGALAAQLTWSATSARGIAIGVLIAAFLLRALADVSDLSGGSAGWLGWLSPIGWAHRVRPYAGEQWWILPVAAMATAALWLGAAVLSRRRDPGAGLLPTRLGPDTAAPWLRTPLALAWRLQEGSLLVWMTCAVLVGLVMGGVADSTTQTLAGNKDLRDVFARIGGSDAVIDANLASTMTIFAVLASACAIQATLKLRVEEASGRAESVLSTAVGRVSWAASHLVFSLLGSAAVLAAAGLASGVAYGASTGHVARESVRGLGAALAQLPAVWVLAALTIALVGVLPRLASAAWGLLAVFLLLALVGPALQWNERVLGLSPFAQIPKIPGGAFSTTPLLWLTLVAAAITTAGLLGLRRRDIPIA